MKKSFSYPLPDELYLNSFELGKKFSADYDGPEKLKVLITKITGEISGIDPENYSEDHYDLIEIDSNESPEICFYILNSSDTHVYEYEEEIMTNGDSYQKVLNPTIFDAYSIFYDYNESKFKLDLIVKNSEVNFVTSHFYSIRNRLNFIKLNEEGKKEKNEKQDVSEETLLLIDNFLNDLDKCIEENSMFPEWKYTNFDTIPDTILPIPEDLKSLLSTYQ